MICHGTPCTSISVQGKQEGADEGSNTASSLIWYSTDIIGRLRSKYVIWENVPNILSARHKHNFEKYLQKLEFYGYSNSYTVLNAVDYGVPQNRKRIYCVSMLEDRVFTFSEGKKEKVCLADILESNVDEKYYLNDYQVRDFIANTKPFKPNKIHLLGRLSKFYRFDNCQRLYGIDGVAPTLATCCGGGTVPKIACDINGYYYKNTPLEKNDRVRELTPLECLRLMDFDDEDYIKLRDFSDRQIRKLAGNSIVVAVLQSIFRDIFMEGKI